MKIPVVYLTPDRTWTREALATGHGPSTMDLCGDNLPADPPGETVDLGPAVTIDLGTVDILASAPVCTDEWTVDVVVDELSPGCLDLDQPCDEAT